MHATDTAVSPVGSGSNAGVHDSYRRQTDLSVPTGGFISASVAQLVEPFLSKKHVVRSIRTRCSSFARGLSVTSARSGLAAKDGVQFPRPLHISLCSTVIVPQPSPSFLSSKHPVKQQIQPIVPSSIPLTRISQADAPSQTIKPQAFSTQGSAYADNTPDATVKHITLPSRMPHASHRSPA